MAPPTYVERGFQEKLKTGAVFLDLTAAYDTVWIDGLVTKLTRIIKCKHTLKLFKNLLTNRKNRVVMNGKQSRRVSLRDGLPQGSVLAPSHFNIFIADIPDIKSRKFAYADDLAIAFQSKSFDELEKTLNADLATLHEYYNTWHLIPNPNKTVCSTMHLNNRAACRKLNITLNGHIIRHEDSPKYLGVTLDRTLSYGKHLENTKQKLKTRNSILRKLAGSTWGSGANTLRMSALALVYSTAEYCAPVWSRSPHVSKVDVQLNDTMRIITGSLRATPTEWLPVLANIEPPKIRRNKLNAQYIKKIYGNLDLPIHRDIITRNRLKSRKPLWTVKEELQDFDQKREWQNLWINSNCKNKWLVEDPTRRIKGFCLPRRLWVSLNRVRTGVGRCRSFLVKWGMRADPMCDCGHIQDMDHLLNCEVFGFDGNLEEVHELKDAALKWLEAISCVV